MSSDQRMSTALVALRPAHVAAVALCLSLAACSADVTRFENANFNLNDEKAPSPQAPGAPYPRAGLTGEGTNGVPPPANRFASGVQGPGYTAQALPPPNEIPSANRSAPVAERRAPRAVASGETVEVQAGDTLYGLARRHHVTAAALAEVNNMVPTATIKPGQRLSLPTGATPAAPTETPRVAPAKIPVAKASRVEPAPVAASAAASDWQGKHTLASGESLYALSRQYKVTLSELQSANGISDPARVRIGTVLKVPTSRPGAIPAQEVERAPTRTAQQPASPAEPATPPGITPGVRVLNQPERRAALPDRANDAEPPAMAETVPASSGTHFPWPARGKVIAGFGKRPDGSPNEGIKIQLPMGSDVRAVEGGRVLYASSEIQAYGNLVLIQHDNGWVSAYGHADRLLVKHDDIVKKGQVIAKSGRTGLADQPQLHFELRKGNKPVDPIAYLDK